MFCKVIVAVELVAMTVPSKSLLMPRELEETTGLVEFKTAIVLVASTAAFAGLSPSLIVTLIKALVEYKLEIWLCASHIAL